MKEQVQLQIGGKLENLSLVSNFIDNSMTKFGLGDYQTFQIQIAVDEAVKNIIKHLNLDRNKIQLKFERKEDEIEIVIEYGGNPFDPTKESHLQPSSEDETESMKIYFVKRYMNKIKHEFSNGINILTLVKRV